VTSKAYAEHNKALIPQLVSNFRCSICKPILSFSTILHLFQEVRLKYKKLSECYMSETVMELLSSVNIIGTRQCKHSVSFKGDCHKYAMFCSKFNQRLHCDDFSIMDLLQLAPRLILDHFGLGTSSWSTDVIERLQSGGSSEWQCNPASIIFSSAEAMIKSIQDMDKVPRVYMGIERCLYGFGLDHNNVFDASKDRIIQINQTDALKMDMGMKDKRAHCDKIRSTHAVLVCFFEILSPGYNRYMALYREK